MIGGWEMTQRTEISIFVCFVDIGAVWRLKVDFMVDI